MWLKWGLSFINSLLAQISLFFCIFQNLLGILCVMCAFIFVHNAVVPVKFLKVTVLVTAFGCHSFSMQAVVLSITSYT